MNLFDAGIDGIRKKSGPLAYRVRPAKLEEFMGQEEAVGENSFLKKALNEGKIPSMIFWGPPGTGKTTLALIIAGMINAEFIPMSAVSSGIKDVKETIEKAKINLRLHRKTILFIDEIHRFNKAQQDAFLPHVEDGTVILIGATTENPSFEVNSALLSRAKVVRLEPLQKDALAAIISRALSDDEMGIGASGLTISEEALDFIDRVSNGDARRALNIVEMSAAVKKGPAVLTREDVESAAGKKAAFYDKNGEEHYNIISALHKSLRDSDPDASLYWMARMLEGGEEPLYIARRMVRFASEDIGNADPQALVLALAAKDAFEFLGHPEGELALAQAAVYLACAPKSNACYTAFSAALKDSREFRDEPVPLHIRNAPTKMMKEFGYGKGYKYAHDFENAQIDQDHMPEKLKGRKYYEPKNAGFEAGIKQRLEQWQKKQP